MAHEGLVGVLRIEELVEKVDDLRLVLRRVKVRGDAGEIDALAQVVGAAVFEPFEENGDPVRGGGLPVFVQHSPEVPRDRVLFGERQIDHRQDRALAREDAAEEERDHRVLDIGAIEMAWNRGAEFGQRRREVGRLGRLGGGGGRSGERAGRDGGGAEDERASLDRERGDWVDPFAGPGIFGTSVGGPWLLGHRVTSLKAADSQ